ncbi:hypothetical protein F4804DRAFT_301353 [Jackrogersella minutella]|nr:hypothetical protein F4804DRAFT_301353 [Jackrogersella minutella]
MTRRLALSAFCASNGAFECAARRIAMSTHRTFSSTAQRNKNMIHFTPTSSPELDDVLNLIRHQIILPAYLPTEQRIKLTKKKYEKSLQSDPITMEIDGEVIKFRYRSPFREIINTRTSLFQALTHFSTPEDFANLSPLLEGLANAKRIIRPQWYCKIIRICGDQGFINVILECARAVRRTNFKLNSSESSVSVLHYIQMKAVDSDWDPEETAQALRWAEMVLDMLQEPEHLPKVKTEAEDEGQLPLHKDPLALLAPLHLAAALVLKQGAEADPALLEKVTRYAKDIILLWPEGKGLKEIQPAVLYEDDKPLEYLMLPNKFTGFASPLLYGLQTAAKLITDPELAAQLQARADLLAEEVSDAREKARLSKEAAAAEQKVMLANKGEMVWRKIFEGENKKSKNLNNEIKETEEEK